tara:strand:+ start:336 stop:974 length:639 start_codon:yes stop_codon:yes gene_type:complete
MSIKDFFKAAPPGPAPPGLAPPAPPPEGGSKEHPPAIQAGDEQAFVDFFRSKCKHPIRGNGFVQSRKVAVFGKRHVHGADVTHAIGEVPASFVEWAKHNKYRFNSVTCNLYEEKRSNIAWHCDSPDALEHPEVVSLSFALSKEQRGSKLASMEFRWKHGAYPGGFKTKAEPLFHGTAVRWNARKHKKLRCEHRVAATRRPRLNVTLRLLKQP